jgi:16S rRNA (uracil1498-N3)-methyltransferase
VNEPIHNLFFLPPEQIRPGEIRISGTEFHHLKNVLRKKKGEIIHATDGRGRRYRLAITGILKDQISVRIRDQELVKPESGMRLDLAFVPLKTRRNDVIIEKAIELGVSGFGLFGSRFSVVKRMGDSKIEHLRRVAISAMLQSRRYYLPQMIVHPDPESLIRSFGDYDLVILADPEGRPEIRTQASSILYIVGPEGGFDRSEQARFADHDVQTMRLGPNRLRSETAAICGLAKILAIYKKI